MQLALHLRRFSFPIVLLASSFAFALLKGVVDDAVGFSYGDSSSTARVVHDVAMMTWGGSLILLYRWFTSGSTKR